MLVFKLPKFSFIFLIILSCGQPLPQLEGIDLNQWKQDKDGCESLRTPFIEKLDVEKDKLKRLTEMQVVDMLGRPDENILLTRNQKFYHYYLQAGPNCSNSNPVAKKLVLRFNAMGILKEALIE